MLLSSNSFVSAATYKSYTPNSATDYIALRNPGRGLLYQQDVFLSKPDTYITPSVLKSALSPKSTPGINLIQPVIYLDNAISGLPLTAANLAAIGTMFNNIRDAGVVSVVRFAYTDQQLSSLPEPTPDAIVNHIQQLAPLLQAASDVVLTVQLGFIGVWGEGYYTSSYYGKAGVYSPAQQAARDQVTTALLEALEPNGPQIQMRTPALKQAFLNSSEVSVTEQNAFNISDVGARIGHFDDCFLASANDQGTYRESSLNGPDHTYIAAESQWTVRGGETCVPSKASLYSCPRALQVLEQEHWTFLHIWNAKYVTAWKKGGCWQTIQARLGYWLTIDQGTFFTGSDEDDMIVGWKNLTGTNLGFAAPMMKYELEVLLIPSSLIKAGSKVNFTGFITTIPLTDASLPSLDMRYWTGSLAFPDITLCQSNGSYSNTTDSFEMFWNIHGVSNSDPSYRILLGQAATSSTPAPSWLAKTRINRLGVSVEALPQDNAGVQCNQRMNATSFTVDEDGVLVW